MLLPLLIGCATTPWGTWAFTLAVTPATGEECTTEVSHNLTGAHTPVVATTTDESWSQTSSTSTSPTLFFGRVEESGQGAMLIVGASAYPGSHADDGTWTFAWTGSEDGDDESVHATGYDYLHHWENADTRRVKGTFNTDTFTGTYSDESTAREKWDESDTWSEEAAAYVGEHGEAPVGTYLVLTDGSGVDYAASNSRDIYDCDSASCALTVESNCGYSYDITGQLTDFAGEDAQWTEDAGQPAGL